MGQVDLGTMESGLNGNWSSTDLNIQNNILDLEGLNPGEYNLTFSVSDDIGWCPTDFDTSIEVIGCFESEEVLTVDVGIDQLIFSWTDELESLDLEIVVLQGPIGVLDGNTYTMSGMSEGEQGGIEIFINTENYQYDNDLVIYGITANPTAVNDPAYQLDLISVYPNPVTEVIILEIANSSMSINSVEIVTSAGITIDKDVEILNNEVNVSKLGNGYYILLIDVDGKKFQLPFVKI